MGVLITFEGSEGTGKSTQLELLKQTLVRDGYRVSSLKFYEPGGTDFADTIRAIVKQRYDTSFVNDKLANVKDIMTSFELDPLTQALCFFAARSHQFRYKVKSELDAGNIIILDRSIDSTTVYQGYAQDPSLIPWIRMTNSICLATHHVTIDKTLLFDAPVSVCRSRVKSRSGDKDFFDSKPESFFEMLRSGYLAEADFYAKLPQSHAEYNRIAIIDAVPAPDVMHKQVMSQVYTILERKGIKPNIR